MLKKEKEIGGKSDSRRCEREKVVREHKIDEKMREREKIRERERR